MIKKIDKKNTFIYNECEIIITAEIIGNIISENNKNKNILYFIQNPQLIESSSYEEITISKILEADNSLSQLIEQKYIVIEDDKLLRLYDYIGKYNWHEFIDITKSFLSEIEFMYISKHIIDSDNYFDFPFENVESEYQFPKRHEYPLNYISSSPRYCYPTLSTKLTLPFIDHVYKYGKHKVAILQQFEINTNEVHSCFLYKKAGKSYTVNYNNIISILNNYFPILNFNEFANSLRKYLIDFDIDNFLSKLNDYVIREHDVIINFSIELSSLIKFASNLLTEIKDEIVKFLSKYGITYSDEFVAEYQDLDYFGNKIPLYFKIENDNVIYYDDFVEYSQPTNFLVAKKLNNIKLIEEYGLNVILNNNNLFPQEYGLYHINTPNIIYFYPLKNRNISKGFKTLDGVINKEYLKRFRVLYAPTFEYVKDKIVKLENYTNFKVQQERVIKDLPVLAYSYIISPMNIYDINKLVNEGIIKNKNRKNIT